MVAAVSDLCNEPRSGMIKPNIINKVKVTAMWAIILFSFLTPLFIAINKIPMMTGIKAVAEGDSDWMYPYPPSAMRVKAFIKLNCIGF